MTTKIDELKALMAAYDANSRSPARLIDLKSALFDNASALIAAVEALRDAYSVGQIVGGSKKAAQAALAPFGE